jgi:hypothetical protein
MTRVTELRTYFETETGAAASFMRTSLAEVDEIGGNFEDEKGNLECALA